MKTLKLTLCAGVASLGLAFASAATADTAPAAPAAAPAAPAPTAPPYPSMGPTLSNNVNSASFDAGPLGKVTVNGVISGLGFVEDHAGLNTWDGKSNGTALYDASNGMVTIQKTDGPFQFVVQAGIYSFPALGAGYIRATDQPEATFGYAPVAYGKWAPTANFSIIAGQLPTLIGAELPFTYQNANIERGLLWNQEPLISRGVQGNYTMGPWAFSLSVNDGYYSNDWTTVSGLVTYTFKNSDTLSLVGSGNTSTNFKHGVGVPFATVIPQQEGEIFNLIYNHTQGPWTVTPYVQFTNVPATVVSGSGTNWGVAVIAKYSFNSEFSIAGRVEYEGSSGVSTLYGPKSSAWSATLTPTYQKGIFFARVEVGYVGVSGITRFIGGGGTGLGIIGDRTEQLRGALESGFMF